MYVGWRSDELSGHATDVLKAKCTWLVEYEDGSGQTFSSIS
jgi:hypothetical protein